eukprot:5268974-Amphidinium_carterae.1
MAAPPLLWECVKEKSCFLVKRRNAPIMTKDMQKLETKHCTLKTLGPCVSSPQTTPILLQSQ